MNLIDSMLEPFTIMNKITTSDGEGGYNTIWSEGATINAIAVLDNSTEALIAEAQGVTSTYTITTSKNTKLDYHDVLMRVSDKKIFRVTSAAKDIESPSVSTLDIAQVKAEKWSLND